MHIETWATIIGVILVVLTNVVLITVSFTSVKNEVKAVRNAQVDAVKDRKESDDKFEKLHGMHFAHAAKTEIHQEAMSRAETILHVESAKAQVSNIGLQLKAHSEADMAIFEEMKEDLKEIRKAVNA